jgi:glycosyltransferase involved in cell wall biosynthesis
MADAVIAVSEETKRDVLRLFNIDENHIRIIYNGIDPEEYYPRSSRDHLAKNGINPDQPYILFVGRIARQKGIIHLARYAKRGGNFVLVVSGSLEADGTNQLIEIVYDLLIEAIQLGSLGCFEFGVSAVGLK